MSTTSGPFVANLPHIWRRNRRIRTSVLRAEGSNHRGNYALHVHGKRIWTIQNALMRPAS